MEITKFSFTNWLASRNAVSFTLAVGVIFLITNYQGIIFRANPENLNPFEYPYFLQVLLSHLDSFFFGLATAIIIFQSKSEVHKVMYCSFEAIMIFLNLNRNFINEIGFNSQFLLATYVAIFSGFTLYYLGKLAQQGLVINQPEIQPLSEIRNTDEIMSEADQISYLRKYSKVVDDLEKGMSILKAAKKHKVSKSTIQNIKRTLKILKNGHFA